VIDAIIIDDEPKNVEVLENLLNTHCSHLVRLRGSASCISSAMQLIQKQKPQLIYLDIELSDGNAFELLEKVEHFRFLVIFITAFNEYAVKAFRSNAIDYLLKPISHQELLEATEKAFERINNITGKENILKVLKQITTAAPIHKIPLTVADGVIYIKPEEIIRIEAKSNYSILYLTNEDKITCIKTLKEILHLLPENIFLRVHHSWVINTAHLKKYYRHKESYIQMEDGATVPVSIRKKEKLISFFSKSDEDRNL
jgi:two-component system, LytTR family, response regulator